MKLLYSQAQFWLKHSTITIFTGDSLLPQFIHLFRLSVECVFDSNKTWQVANRGRIDASIGTTGEIKDTNLVGNSFLVVR